MPAAASTIFAGSHTPPAVECAMKSPGSRGHRLLGYCSVGCARKARSVFPAQLHTGRLSVSRLTLLTESVRSERCLMLMAPANLKPQGRRSSTENRFRTFATVAACSLHLVCLSWALAKSSKSKSVLQKRVWGFANANFF